jgi:hypothetical protein
VKGGSRSLILKCRLELLPEGKKESQETGSSDTLISTSRFQARESQTANAYHSIVTFYRGRNKMWYGDWSEISKEIVVICFQIHSLIFLGTLIKSRKAHEGTP